MPPSPLLLDMLDLPEEIDRCPLLDGNQDQRLSREVFLVLFGFSFNISLVSHQTFVRLEYTPPLQRPGD